MGEKWILDGETSLELLPGQRLTWIWDQTGRLPITVEFGEFGSASFWLRREDPVSLLGGARPFRVIVHDPRELPDGWPAGLGSDGAPGTVDDHDPAGIR